MVPTVQQISDSEEGVENLLTKECLSSYTSNWNLVHYKYAAYSGGYLELPRYANSMLEINWNLCLLFCRHYYFINFQNIESR